MAADSPARLKVKRLRPSARLPERRTPGSAGLDIYADLAAEGESLELGDRPRLVPTGIAVEPPPGYEVQIRPRSGLSKEGVDVAFGTVDGDYRGELRVNMSVRGGPGRRFRIRHGDRIAQIVVAPVTTAVVEEVSELSPTDRGADGFGSTGR